MPLVRIVSNHSSSLDTPAAEALLAKVSVTVAKLLGKPERWVMTCLDPAAAMTFAGTNVPTCYVEVKNIGALPTTTAQQVSSELCQILSEQLGVPSDRIYIEFAEATGRLWGFDGSTFG